MVGTEVRLHGYIVPPVPSGRMMPLTDEYGRSGESCREFILDPRDGWKYQ